MTVDELLEYIETKHLKKDINLLLLFNDIGFYMLPLNKPMFVHYKGRLLFQANEYRIFTNEWFEMDYSVISNRIIKWISNPNHLYACEIGFKDLGILEVTFSRNSEGIERLWANIVTDFIERADIQTPEQLNSMISVAKRKYNEYYDNIVLEENDIDEICDTYLFWGPPILHDDDFIKHRKTYLTIRERYYEISNHFKKKYQYGIIRQELAIGMHPITNKEVELQVILQFKELSDLQTSLKEECIIVNREDQIPDVLYNIAAKIKATVLKIAVGYVYRKGLELIIPTMQLVKVLGGNVELGIGALQNYNNNTCVTGMDKVTACYLNELKDDRFLDEIFTCSDYFYHGKYYYISNGEISYVIMGSSNVTKSAYNDNIEFDLLFRMDLSNAGMQEREQSFVKWYDELKQGSIPLDLLDIEKFQNTSHKGRTSIKQDSRDRIRKHLNEDEEQKLLDFILTYLPDEIYEYPFKGGLSSYKAFKKYHVFEFNEKNLIVLEAFSYGDACYVFSANSFLDIKLEFSNKSKSQMQKSDLYITSIEHGEYFWTAFDTLMK